MFLGATLEDSRYSTGQGCVYPLLYDGMRQMSDTGMFNFPYAFELALNNGKSRLTDEQISIKTGDPRKFKSYEDVWEAFKKQLEYLVRQQVIASTIFMRIHEERFPELLDSFMSIGCVEKAVRSKHPLGGGCKYPFMIVTPVMGLGDVADSLMAIKKLVFEQKKTNMAELIDALDNNFKDKEPLRQMLINDAPKFGQDDDEVDSITREVDELLANEHYKYRHTDGSYRYYNSYASTSANVPMGIPVGALPCGRLAGVPLSDNSSPAHGVAESKGPTAILNSETKGLSIEQAARNLLNMKFTADTFKKEDSIDKFIAMIKTYFEDGGFHVQFNVVNNEVLRDAQKHPENYPDLLVRVAGYSAYFTSLSKECQDDLIDRGELSIA
jgi:formate C-acetyltransferase